MALQLHIQDFSFKRTMSHLSPQPGSSTPHPSSCIFIMPQRAQHGVCKLARQELVGILIIALSEKNPRDTSTVSLPTSSLSILCPPPQPLFCSQPATEQENESQNPRSESVEEPGVCVPVRAAQCFRPYFVLSSPLLLELSHFAFPKNGWSSLMCPGLHPVCSVDCPALSGASCALSPTDELPSLSFLHLPTFCHQSSCQA